MRALVGIVVLLVCTSCYTPIWMGRVPDSEEDKLHRGMIVFLPRRSIVTYQLTQREDPVTHAVTQDCTRIEQDEIAMLADTSQRYRLSLWQPVVGSSESGINLSGGVVTSVTQKADTKIPETIGAVTELVSTVAPLALGGGTKGGAVDTGGAAPAAKPACNTGKRVFEIDGKPAVAGSEVPVTAPASTAK